MKMNSTALACATAAVLVMALTACTSVKLQANKDQAAVRKVNRMFLLIQHGDLGEQSYSNDLADALRNAFTNTPVLVDVGIMNPVELDERIHLQRIDSFGADSVMVI